MNRHQSPACIVLKVMLDRCSRHFKVTLDFQLLCNAIGQMYVVILKLLFSVALDWDRLMFVLNVCNVTF